MGKLDGRVGIVTGSARGQGAVMARMLVTEGARVVVSDTRRDLGRAIAEELGSDAVYAELDVRDPAQWEAAIGLAVDSFGSLDILINNAGVNLSASIEDTSLEDFRLIQEVNSFGTWLGIKSVLPAMRDRGGTIVNIGSISVHTTLTNKSAYLASKHAVRGVTKAAAAELGRYGIRVNAVHPGGVASEMTVGMPRDQFANLPIPRIGQPDDIAKAVLFFVSDDSPYCTGTEISVDGGRLVALMPAPPQPAAEGAPTSSR